MNDKNIVLECKNIKKIFGSNEVLKGIDLNIFEFERVAIVGGNGAGKTTLLNIISGNDKKFDGEIKTKIAKEEISFQFQTTNYPNDISIYELLNMFESEKDSKKRKEIIKKKLESVKLWEHKNKSTVELSGGQMQKLNLLLTMATNPKLVFFDEILSGLDMLSVDDIFIFFDKFIKNKYTSITVSHNANEIFKTCTRVLFMVDGKFTNDVPIENYDSVDSLEEAMKNYIIVNDLIDYESIFNNNVKIVEKHKIEAKGIIKRYEDKYVLTGNNGQGISLNIEPKERLAIIGKNGSGKSTFVEIISGVKRKNKGEIFVYDSNQINVYKKKRAIIFGLQFQKHFYPSTMNLRDIVVFNLKSNNIKYDENYIKTILRSVDLYSHSLNNSFQISGGQRQKLNIILTLIKKPSILIVDELTTGLDVLAREKLTILINEYLKRNDATLIMVTHSAEDLVNLSEKIVILKNGVFVGEMNSTNLNKKESEKILREI